jgi:uncharacterized protein
MDRHAQASPHPLNGAWMSPAPCESSLYQDKPAMRSNIPLPEPLEREDDAYRPTYVAAGLLILAIGLTLTRVAFAGVQLATPEPIRVQPDEQLPLQTEPLQKEQPIESGPVGLPPLQRLEEVNLEARREIESLTQLAASDPRPTKGDGATRALDPGQAAWMLGLIYLHSAGVPQDLGMAQTWFERAAKLRSGPALAGLAWCAIEGCRTPANPAEAERWITPYKRVNRARALYLEWLALDRLAPLRTATPDLLNNEGQPELRGRHLLSAAARGGDIHALIELGLDAMARQQPAQALRYFQAAAPKSHIAASNAAIVSEAIQAGKPKQRSDASKLAEELYTEAQHFHRGEGRAVNYVEAIRLYRLAADKGSVEAQRMLALIYSRPLVRGSFDVQWISQLSELDLTRSTPGLRTKTAPRQLQRERTALIDLLPEKWRARIL